MDKRLLHKNNALENIKGTNDACTLHNILFVEIQLEEYDENPNYT